MKRQRYNIQISEITNKKGDIRKNSEETQTIDHQVLLQKPVFHKLENLK